MNVRELRRLVADLDDETVVWFDPASAELVDGSLLLPVKGASLAPATGDRMPGLILRGTPLSGSMS